MKFEFSAGGIVLRPIQQVQGKQVQDKFTKNKWAVLLCQHSQHHGWVFPKGLIGDNHKGETKEETAVREVEEETGVVGKLIAPLTPATYWYQFEGQKVRKTVYYFVMEYVSGDTAKHDFEMEQVEWLPLEEVEQKLSYKSDKQAWNEAKKIIGEVA